MRNRRRIEEPRVTLEERVVAALLTPLLFNAAVIISVAMLSKRTHYTLFHLGDLYRALGSAAVMLLVAPALVGFLAGSGGTAWIFGHAFWTHHEHQRSGLATALVWAVFGATVVYVNTHATG